MDTFISCLCPASPPPLFYRPPTPPRCGPLSKKGTHKSRKITRARALLAMGSGKGAVAVHAEVGISTTQYHRLKRHYLAGGWARPWKSARAAGNRRR